MSKILNWVMRLEWKYFERPGTTQTMLGEETFFIILRVAILSRLFPNINPFNKPIAATTCPYCLTAEILH